MKTIITILVLFSFAATTQAATLVPSLQFQMTRQTQVNKKNAVLERKRAIEERKTANRARLAALRYKNSLPKRQSVQIASSQIKSTVSAPSPALTIKPPTITQVPKPVVYTPAYTVANTVANVDMNRVRDTWLSWYNATRSAKWLSPYSYDASLDRSAHDWNIVFAGSRGTIYHERSPGDGFYNFSVIDQWFRDRWVNPPIIHGVKHSENVSYAWYRCNQSECTDELISALRGSYNFFMNSSSHYPSIVQPNFTKIGIDVIANPSQNRSYITVHYMTE